MSALPFKGQDLDNKKPPFLREMSHRGYRSARPFWVRIAWHLVQEAVFANGMVTSYPVKRMLLRRFGAQLGSGVLIKPRVRVKCPWELSVGDDCWIGEAAWIDNFVSVSIGSNVCISQGAYLCTGNHDWSDRAMGLVVQPIVIEDGAWVGAFSRVGPGVTLGARSVLTLGCVVTKSTKPGSIYAGSPAVEVKRRAIKVTQAVTNQGRFGGATNA